jgi:predicted metal-dependent enzyme (double-stranded beta helix superfamily)
MSEADSIAAFIQDVKAILAEAGPSDAGLTRIASRMGRFVKETGAGDGFGMPSGNIHEGPRAQSGPLYQDETGLTLVRARFGPEALTPIHNHGSWGVIGVYQGRDRYQLWRRLDDGHGPGQAAVELVEERVLAAGDVVILPPPPQDIHAQQGLDGEVALEYVLFGRGDIAMTQPRVYFDPAQGTAEQVVPGRG